MPATEPLGPMVRMRAIRDITGMTLQQVCDRVAERGVSISVGGLSNIESGRRAPSAQFLVAYAAALGFNHLDIWKGPIIQVIETEDDTPATPAAAAS